MISKLNTFLDKIIPRWLVYLSDAVLVVFICIISYGCGVFGDFILSVTLNENRAVVVGNGIMQHVEPLYSQVAENIPGESVLIHEDKPNFSTYAFGLSMGATRLAHIEAASIYRVPFPPDDLLRSYNAVLGQSGWRLISANNETDDISSIFQHPDEENLLAGICRSSELAPAPGMVEYTVFFDYDELNSASCTPRLHCVISRYCGKKE